MPALASMRLAETVSRHQEVLVVLGRSRTTLARSLRALTCSARNAAAPGATWLPRSTVVWTRRYAMNGSRAGVAIARRRAALSRGPQALRNPGVGSRVTCP